MGQHPASMQEVPSGRRSGRLFHSLLEQPRQQAGNLPACCQGCARDCEWPLENGRNSHQSQQQTLYWPSFCNLYGKVNHLCVDSFLRNTDKYFCHTSFLSIKMEQVVENYHQWRGSFPPQHPTLFKRGVGDELYGYLFTGCTCWILPLITEITSQANNTSAIFQEHMYQAVWSHFIAVPRPSTSFWLTC